MSLFDVVKADNKRIFDSSGGPAVSVTITAPDQRQFILPGVYNDIAFLVDPDTGAAVSNREVSVAFNVEDLRLAGIDEFPSYVADENEKPWTCDVVDTNGDNHVFMIARTDPDRGMGVILCTLEMYRG